MIMYCVWNLVGQLVFMAQLVNSSWKTVNRNKCQYTVNSHLTIHYTQNPMLFIVNKHIGSLDGCREFCCNDDICNGYVYDASEYEDCRLLKCSVGGDDCKKIVQKKFKGPEVLVELGFITGYSSDAGEVRPLHSLSAVIPATTMPNSIEFENSISDMDLSKKSQAGEQDSSILSSTTASLSHTSALLAITANISSPSSPIDNSTTMRSTAGLESNLKTMGDVDKHQDHTNSLSLSVALVFGVGFMVTVLIMLGRRWVEGIRDAHNRGYTRLSYLLNGE